MATRVHIGSKELRGDIAAYAKRFDLLEIRGVEAANLKLAPTTATLKRWRKAVPPHFEFGVIAGPSVGIRRKIHVIDGAASGRKREKDAYGGRGQPSRPRGRGPRLRHRH